MAGKMNWDRVRKENQSRRSGLSWIGPEATPLKATSDSSPVRRVDSGTARITLGVKASSCTCRKPVGFEGLHNKSCPLTKSGRTHDNLRTNPDLSIRQFAESINKAGQSSELNKFLSSLQRRVDADRTIGGEDRDNMQKSIQALQDELMATPSKIGLKRNEVNTSSQTSLKAFLHKRLDVYLRADNKAAIETMQSAARDLKLRSYRFQCSPSTRHSDLWNYADKQGQFYASILWKAFTKGGICCIEHIEKAPLDFQFWLMSGLDGLASVGGSSGTKRHPDFALVVTGPVPIRELWSGQVDNAFIDRLLYLE